MSCGPREGVRGAWSRQLVLWGEESGESRDSPGGFERGRQRGGLRGFPDVLAARGAVLATAALASGFWVSQGPTGAVPNHRT